MMRFILAALAAFAVCLSIVFAFNWYVDPYAYWGRFPFGMYNDGYAPEMKATMVKRYSHEVTLIGASTGMQIDPDDIPRCRVYNASINGIRPEQILHLVVNFVPRETFVVIGLDFFTFRDDPRRSTSFGLFSFSNVVQYTLSTDAILMGFNALKQLRIGRSISLKTNGARPTDELAHNNEQMIGYDYKNYLDIARRAIFNDFSLSEERFGIIRELKQVFETRGQAYAIYITPTSDPMYAFYREMGITEHFAEFRRRVRDIFPDVYDFTVQRYAHADQYYKIDPQHYLPKVGAQFVDEILAERGCRPEPNSRQTISSAVAPR